MQGNYEECLGINPDVVNEKPVKKSASKILLTNEPVRTISKIKNFEEDVKGTSPGRRKGTNTRLSDDAADNQCHMKKDLPKDPPE